MAGVDEGMICILGAGGPVGAVLYPVLAEHYRLRLTDIRPAADVVAGTKRRSVWPEWQCAPVPPHEWRTCDVTDYEQVLAVMSGCDAAVNLAVNRTDPGLAFPINVAGAYNIMKAAARTGLRRIVHTAVECRTLGYEGDYRYEFDIPDDAPRRPGTELYPHSKHLGMEVVQAFAEQRGLDVISLFLSRLRPAAQFDGRDDDVVQSFSVSWRDLAQAYLCALRAPEMPHPNEKFFICADLPIGKYSPAKAERLLRWTPRDRFERFLTRPYRGPGWER